MAAADKIRVDAEKKAEKKASKNTNEEDEEKSGSNKGDKGPKKPRAKTCKRQGSYAILRARFLLLSSGRATLARHRQSSCGSVK
jgi:hypothetical protein